MLVAPAFMKEVSPKLLFTLPHGLLPLSRSRIRGRGSMSESKPRLSSLSDWKPKKPLKEKEKEPLRNAAPGHRLKLRHSVTLEEESLLPMLHEPQNRLNTSPIHDVELGSLTERHSHGKQKSRPLSGAAQRTKKPPEKGPRPSRAELHQPPPGHRQWEFHKAPIANVNGASAGEPSRAQGLLVSSVEFSLGIGSPTLPSLKRKTEAAIPMKKEKHGPPAQPSLHLGLGVSNVADLTLNLKGTGFKVSAAKALLDVAIAKQRLIEARGRLAMAFQVALRHYRESQVTKDDLDLLTHVTSSIQAFLRSRRSALQTRRREAIRHLNGLTLEAAKGVTPQGAALTRRLPPPLDTRALVSQQNRDRMGFTPAGNPIPKELSALRAPTVDSIDSERETATDDTLADSVTVRQLKQLYFDFYDAEAWSLADMGSSGTPLGTLFPHSGSEPIVYSPSEATEVGRRSFVEDTIREELSEYGNLSPESQHDRSGHRMSAGEVEEDEILKDLERGTSAERTQVESS